MTEQAREVLLAELCRLSPIAQEAVQELLSLYDEHRNNIEAEKFLSELPNIPMSSQGVSKSLIAKLNWAIDILRNSPRWFSAKDLPHEIWRDVVGYEGIYQVSNLSRVKSFYGGKARIFKHHIDIDGYAVVALSQNGKDRVFGVHVLLARAFIDNPDNKPLVHHQDSNRLHSCIWNLEWVTCSENAQYAVKHGSRKGGSASPCAKLTKEQAEEVLRLYVKGSSEFGCYGLAKRFNVHPMTINSIVRGKTYKDIARE